MVSSNNFSKIFSICIVCSVNVILCQDFGFGFPEAAEEDKTKQNANNLKPVYIPNRCEVDELLYPGDHNNDWVCDCKPGYIFHPTTNRCYQAYRQGPCELRHILILPKGNNVPDCRRNLCTLDGVVKFQNKCYYLNQAGPCPLPELHYVVGVNETNLELQCLPLERSTAVGDIQNRFGGEDDENGTVQTTTEIVTKAQTAQCFPGSKRSIQGICNIVEQ